MKRTKEIWYQQLSEKEILILLLFSIDWWCHPAISSSVVPFSSWLQSFPAWGSFLMSWFFISCGHSIGASASASVLSMNIQGWFPLGSTVFIFLLSKGLSRVFSNTTIQKRVILDICKMSVLDTIYVWKNVLNFLSHQKKIYTKEIQFFHKNVIYSFRIKCWNWLLVKNWRWILKIQYHMVHFG